MYSLVLMVGMALMGCSSFGPAKPPPAQPQRDILTRDEILNSTAHQSDALQAIRSLRPQFLATPRRGGSTRASPPPITLYINGVRQIGIESLRNISAARVGQIRYLDPSEALSQFGPVASGGALLVTLYEPPKEPQERWNGGKVERATVETAMSSAVPPSSPWRMPWHASALSRCAFVLGDA